MMPRRYILSATFLIIAGLLFTGLAEAHTGGKMQLASEDAGPFKLTVWTSPDPAVTGEIHVATAVASAETALPILNSEVYIEMIPQDGQGESLSGQATTDNSSNRFLYETIFNVSSEGLYEVTITIVGPGVDWGEATFDLEVGSPPPLGLGIAALVGLAVITGVAVWFYLRSTTPQPALEEADEFDTATG